MQSHARIQENKGDGQGVILPIAQLEIATERRMRRRQWPAFGTMDPGFSGSHRVGPKTGSHFSARCSRTCPMNTPYRRWRLVTFALVAAIIAQIGGMIAMPGRGPADIV